MQYLILDTVMLMLGLLICPEKTIFRLSADRETVDKPTEKPLSANLNQDTHVPNYQR